MRITDLPLRLPTLAIIVLGAAIISVVHSVRIGMPKLSGSWPFEWMLAASLPIFAAQVFILMRINTGKSDRPVLDGFLIFLACVLIDGVVFQTVNEFHLPTEGTISDGVLTFAILIVPFTIWSTLPCIALFAFLAVTVRTFESEKHVAIRSLAAALFFLVAPAVADRIITPHQRILTLTAVDDLRLFALDDQRWKQRIGTLPAGTEAIISYCFIGKDYMVAAIPSPEKPNVLVQTEPAGRYRIARQPTGRFSRPRVLGCSDH